MPSKFPLKAFQPGMVLKVALFFDGGLLLSKGTEFSDKHIQRLESWGIKEVETETAHPGLASIVELTGAAASIDLNQINLMARSSGPLPKGYEIDDGKTYVIEGTLEAQDETIFVPRNVMVEGGIASGANLESTGDIHIVGNVGDGVSIVAGGEIKCSGTILGQEERPATLDCARANIDSAVFTNITAKSDVIAATLTNCIVKAGGAVQVTNPRQGLTNGEIESSKLIKVAFATGMEGKFATIRYVPSDNKQQFLQIQRIEKTIAEKKIEMSKLAKVIEVVKILGDKIAELPAEKKQELAVQTKRFLALKGEISDLDNVMARVSAQVAGEITDFGQCPIQIEKIRPGVEICIGPTKLRLTAFQDATGYHLRNGRLFAINPKQ